MPSTTITTSATTRQTHVTVNPAVVYTLTQVKAPADSYRVPVHQPTPRP